MCNAATIARAGRACLACLAGFALVILSVPAAEAVYGPRTVIGANYQQTSSTTSINGITEAVCNPTATCFILFQLPPQRKPLTVQHVSCRAAVRTGAVREGSLETQRAKAFPLKRTNLVPFAVGGSLWLVNNPAMHLVNPGENPIIRLVASVAAEWSVECSISGQLTQP